MKNCKDRSDEEKCTYIQIPEGYEKIDPPMVNIGPEIGIAHEEALNIMPKLRIENINNIDTKNMVITVTLSIDIHWREPRLTFKNLDQNGGNFVDEANSKKIWLPLDNLIHVNAVVGKFHKGSFPMVEIILKFLKI